MGVSERQSSISHKEENRMSAIDQTQSITKESIQLKSSELVEEVKRIIREGNVRRIVVKQDERTIVELPLAVGVMGTLLAAPLAALAALAALLNDCTIEVEREDITPVSVLAAEQPNGAADSSQPSATLVVSAHPERMVATNGVNVCTQAFGDPADPAVLMLMGANASMLGWPAELCQQIADGRRYVIRFDNRDMGRSTTYPPYAPPYTLEDLARDAIGILDAYGVDRAHAVGISSGGMIAQLLAIHHAERIITITAICSSPDPKAIIAATQGKATEDMLPAPTPAIFQLIDKLKNTDWSDETAAVEAFVAEGRVVAGTGYPFDEAWYRDYATQEYRRASNILSLRFNHPIAEGNTPYWRDRLHTIKVPALVLQGSGDPIFALAHGVALAKDIPGAKFVKLDGVGHILLRGAWPVAVSHILAHTAAPAGIDQATGQDVAEASVATLA
jgi:pimeloyl-ACP methyl ester carboxylesterase